MLCSHRKERVILEVTLGSESKVIKVAVVGLGECTYSEAPRPPKCATGERPLEKYLMRFLQIFLLLDVLDINLGRTYGFAKLP